MLPRRRLLKKFCELSRDALPASAADGRRWVADGDSEIARLIYGTPESDDMLLSLTCEKQSKTFWLWFADQPAPVKAPDKMPIIVFNLLIEGNIARAVRGERIGTLVSTPDWASAGSGQEGRVQP